MNKILESYGFSLIDRNKNIRWYQKQYDNIIGVYEVEINQLMIRIRQRAAFPGTIWLTSAKFLQNKEIKYQLCLDNGQRREYSPILSEYQLKSTISKWEALINNNRA